MGAHITVLVRRLAGERGVDLNLVTGTGAGGRIRKADVLAAANRMVANRMAADRVAADGSGTSAPTAKFSAARTEATSPLRRGIAARMLESLKISAQLTTVVEVDVTEIFRRSGADGSGSGTGPGSAEHVLAFVAVAAVGALKSHPILNATVGAAEDGTAQTITYHDGVQLGISVSTTRGRCVPVIDGAGDLTVTGLGRRIADVTARAHADELGPTELDGGTFTLADAGRGGVLFETPIIEQPQVGILSVGTVVKRIVVLTDDDLGDTMAIRSTAFLALTYDHRIVDGADAARFLGRVKKRLRDASFA